MKTRVAIHDNWRTPNDFYRGLDSVYDFDFDPCPYVEDGELPFDGLEVEWGERNFVNPPYSRKLKEAFVRKALDESRKGKLCVLLLPVSTSTALFHDVIRPNANVIRFLRGRLCFEGRGRDGLVAKKKPGMFDSMIVIFDGRSVSEGTPGGGCVE